MLHTVAVTNTVMPLIKMSANFSLKGYICGLLLGYFFSAIVHELGHVVFGLLHGWKFSYFVVGPVRLYREKLDSRIRVGIEKNITLWCGAGATFPKKYDPENINVFGRILIAGPFTSFVMGIALLPFASSTFILMIAVLSISLGAVSLLPVRFIKTGILFNDGTRAMRIFRGGKERDEEAATFDIVSESVFGEGSVQLSKEFVETLSRSDDPSYSYYGLDRLRRMAESDGDIALAESYSARMAELESKVSRVVAEAVRSV